MNVCYIRQLPSELLLQVFFQCILLHGSRAGFTLASVCRDWRVIIYGRHSLWTTIVINLQHPSQVAEEVPLLRRTLLRSSNLTLTLSITIASPCNSDACEELLGLLRSESKRWRTVTLTMSLPMVNALFSQTTNLRLLRRLEVHVEEDGPHDALESTDALSIHHADGLEELRLCLPVEFVPVGLFVCLRSCSGISGSGSQILRFLRSQCCLERLSLWYHDPSDRPLPTFKPTNLDVVHVPCLRKLRIRVGEPPIDITELLSKLKLPCLESLIITDMETPFSASQKKLFVGFLVNHPTLTSVSFKDSAVTSCVLETVFEALPSLSHLRVKAPYASFRWTAGLEKALQRAQGLRSLDLEFRNPDLVAPFTIAGPLSTRLHWQVTASVLRLSAVLFP